MVTPVNPANSGNSGIEPPASANEPKKPRPAFNGARFGPETEKYLWEANGTKRASGPSISTRLLKSLSSAVGFVAGASQRLANQFHRTTNRNRPSHNNNATTPLPVLASHRALSPNRGESTLPSERHVRPNLEVEIIEPRSLGAEHEQPVRPTQSARPNLTSGNLSPILKESFDLSDSSDSFDLSDSSDSSDSFHSGYSFNSNYSFETSRSSNESTPSIQSPIQAPISDDSDSPASLAHLASNLPDSPPNLHRLANNLPNPLHNLHRPANPLINPNAFHFTPSPPSPTQLDKLLESIDKLVMRIAWGERAPSQPQHQTTYSRTVIAPTS